MSWQGGGSLAIFPHWESSVNDSASACSGSHRLMEWSQCVCASAIDITEKCFIKLLPPTKQKYSKDLTSILIKFKWLKDSNNFVGNRFSFQNVSTRPPNRIIKFQSETKKFGSAQSWAAAQQMALASGADFLPTERLCGQPKKRKRRRRRRERERNEMGHCVVVVRALLMAWLDSNHRSLLLCSRRNLSAKETTKKLIGSHLFLWPRVC
jgi:hypothetical protein